MGIGTMWKDAQKLMDAKGMEQQLAGAQKALEATARSMDAVQQTQHQVIRGQCAIFHCLLVLFPEKKTELLAVAEDFKVDFSIEIEEMQGRIDPNEKIIDAQFKEL